MSTISCEDQLAQFQQFRQNWHQMLMRGTREYPMHEHPFTLLQVQVTDEFGQQLWHPMWLIVLGQRRNELTIMDCYLSYRQRFDMEHTLRFSKQRLLMNSFQTPDVEHEENWVQLTQLAYIQLWAARNLVSALPRPKRKILSQKKDEKESISYTDCCLNQPYSSLLIIITSRFNLAKQFFFVQSPINTRIGIYSHFYSIPARWVFELPEMLVEKVPT